MYPSTLTPTPVILGLEMKLKKLFGLRALLSPYAPTMCDWHMIRYKYCSQRSSARQRRIEWQLTFTQWLDAWAKSGKWFSRGTYKEGYVMCRYGDTGPYAVDNIYIAPNVENVRGPRTKD